MTDGERFLEHLEELSLAFPSDDAEEAALRFTALCYAAAYAVAAKRVRSEPFLTDAERRWLSARLLGRLRQLTALMVVVEGESPSYETLQLAGSVHELAEASLSLVDAEWLERYPEFQRTLSRAGHALEQLIGAAAVEALQHEAPAHGSVPLSFPLSGQSAPAHPDSTRELGSS